MYGIYANIWCILMVNVTIYSIHGSYGNWMEKSSSHGPVTNHPSQWQPPAAPEAAPGDVFWWQFWGDISRKPWKVVPINEYICVVYIIYIYTYNIIYIYVYMSSIYPINDWLHEFPLVPINDLENCVHQRTAGSQSKTEADWFQTKTTSFWMNSDVFSPNLFHSTFQNKIFVGCWLHDNLL